MSPQWRDELRVSLAPRRVTLARVRRGVRPVRGDEVTRRIEGGSAIDWHPALAEMKRLLVEHAGRPADAYIVTSDHWAKYAMVPWSDELSGEKEKLAHARICLHKVYGGVTDSWQLCLADPVPGEPMVMSAVPTALMGDIRSVLDAAGHRLVSAQPQLIAAHNAWRDRLPESGGWFVTLDEGSLAAARLARGGWDRVYTARIGTDWVVELQRLRAFGRLVLRESESGRVYVDAPAWLRELAGDCGPEIEWLAKEPVAGGVGSETPSAQRLHA